MSIQEKIRYGAAELKRAYTKNLGLALGISVGAHLLLIFLYVFAINIGKGGSEKKAPVVSTTKLTDIAPPPQEKNTPPPPPPPMIPPQLQGGGGGGGVAARAGNPAPVPDALIAPDTKDFAVTTELGVATTEGGDGTGFGPQGEGEGLGQPVEIKEPVTVKEVEKVDEPVDFVEDGDQPTYDPAELVKNITYPQMALEHEIEGDVVIQVVVEKDGSVSNVKILQSSNKMFDKAAIDAVKRTTFTPGQQNGQPLRVNLTIPVKFEIRR